MPQWYRGSPVTSLSYVSADASPHLFPLSRDTICRAFCEIYRMPSGTTLLCQHIPRGQYSKIKLAGAQSDQNLSSIYWNNYPRSKTLLETSRREAVSPRTIQGNKRGLKQSKICCFGVRVYEIQNDEVLKCEAHLKTGLDHDKRVIIAAK